MTHKIKLSAVAGAVVLALGAQGAVAGNGTPQGAHDYSLNIIGVEKGKKVNMTDSNRRTIFVPLRSSKTGTSDCNYDSSGTCNTTELVNSKIWLVQGDSFAVCDGNGFDEAYSCTDSDVPMTQRSITYNADGEQVAVLSTKIGATFQLPCNVNIPNDQEVLQACDPSAAYADYSVYVRGLGKPGGRADINTCAYYDTDTGTELLCSLETAVVSRSSGKSTFADVTNEMTSVVWGECLGDIHTETNECLGTVKTYRTALFSGEMYDFFWNYNNQGLRLAQFRFYDNGN